MTSYHKDPDAIAARTQTYSDFVRAKQPAKGRDEVLLPGDPENISRKRRHAEGIPVDDETISQIMSMANTFELEEVSLRNLLEMA